MKLVDANVLLYADNTRAEQHEMARKWLLNGLAGFETLLVPWLVSLAYLRVATNPRAVAQPLTIPAACDFLRKVLGHPRVVVPEPDSRHLERVEMLLRATGVGGNLVGDAHLAALALQHEAAVVSFDHDFGRFPGVSWERPGD